MIKIFLIRLCFESKTPIFSPIFRKYLKKIMTSVPGVSSNVDWPSFCSCKKCSFDPHKEILSLGSILWCRTLWVRVNGGKKKPSQQLSKQSKNSPFNFFLTVTFCTKLVHTFVICIFMVFIGSRPRALTASAIGDYHVALVQGSGYCPGWISRICSESD
jgi:hypothetical protein